jgi:hypothetical protein
MVVIRRTSDGLYLGRYSKKRHAYQATENLNEAKRYTTRKRAVAALSAMGYYDSRSRDSLEIEEVV